MRESCVVVIQIETLHNLSVLIFACIYFWELQKIVFCEYLFLQMASFWNFWVYKFQPQRKKNKKKTVESRDIRPFLSRSRERQVGHDGKTIVIDWFWKKAELTNIFCSNFFSCIYFQEVWILCISSVYLFLWMPLKK